MFVSILVIYWGDQPSLMISEASNATFLYSLEHSVDILRGSDLTEGLSSSLSDFSLQSVQMKYVATGKLVSFAISFAKELKRQVKDAHLYPLHGH